VWSCKSQTRSSRCAAQRLSAACGPRQPAPGRWFPGSQASGEPAPAAQKTSNDRCGSGELATHYIAEKYWGAHTPEKIAALWQEDREQLSLLGTLAAGVAGGMAGNSSAAGIAAGIGKKGINEPPTTVKPTGKTSSFDANEIRFSQNTVSYNKTDRDTGVKYNYDDPVSSMKKDGWKADPVDVIKMPDGKMTSMDNTRISAAREAGIKVEANVRRFDDLLPKDMVESGRFGSAKTWGDAILGRINNQSGGFGKKNPVVHLIRQE